MCGIAGYWAQPGVVHGEEGERILRAMSGRLAHRGPDSEGIWKDDAAGIGFAHRRLAILDLTSAGAQPMQSASGRYVIAYNGEIYNHLILRRELDMAGSAPNWRGHSDTETLLAAIEHWGLEHTLRRVYGMFAIVLWDQKERALFLARDRMGEKPLYWGRVGGTFLFGSELKGLRAFPQFCASINQEAVGAYLRFAYVPTPHTIYENIYKLRPGHVLHIRTSAHSAPSTAYWSLKSVVENRAGERARPRSYQDIVAQMEQVLAEVIKSQMISDVPLGVFLSGGIDSSLVTALMQSQTGHRVHSFSIGFEVDRFDEANQARAVARHLGTDHSEFAVSERDAIEVIPQLPDIFDEPFADSSQLPTILLSRITRKAVKVALSGDGGDETFGGYNRHILAPPIWRHFGRLPRPARQLIAMGASAAQYMISDKNSGMWLSLFRRFGLPVTAIDRISKFGGALERSYDFEAFYKELVSAWHPADISHLEKEARSIIDEPDQWPALDDKTERLMALDALSYLPDDILVKVDRSSMSCSLETRAPYLDARVVEHSWTLPRVAKVHGRVGKRVLRDILSRYLPPTLFERPKQGFAIPLDAWLRGSLKDWATGLLSRQSIERHGLIDASAVERTWQRHLCAKDNAGAQLWNVLMLQSWLQAQGKA